MPLCQKNTAKLHVDRKLHRIELLCGINEVSIRRNPGGNWKDNYFKLYSNRKIYSVGSVFQTINVYNFKTRNVPQKRYEQRKLISQTANFRKLGFCNRVVIPQILSARICLFDFAQREFRIAKCKSCGISSGFPFRLFHWERPATSLTNLKDLRARGR